MGDKWKRTTILYSGDSINAVAWTEEEGAKCRMARHLMRAFVALQVHFDFQPHPYYLRTYHDEMCDFILRASDVEVNDKLERERGLTRIDVTEA